MKRNADGTVAKRDAAATKERITKAALAEFGTKGYGGARMATIAKKARCNIRMLYHYFSGKQQLYLACLERVYTNIREAERALNLLELEPEEAIRQLVDVTFSHMAENRDFVQIAGVENTLRGRFLKNVAPVPSAALDHIETIRKILACGQERGIFREDIDALQLYVSILALSYLHLSNQYTLSITYGTDLGDAAWLRDRRTHVREMVTAYVKRSA
ncbi:MAG: TetR family transcriptional regulator [Rhodovibrionaceae bacterium]